MEQISALMDSLATLLWPVIVIVLIVAFRPALAAQIESAKSRKFTIVVGGQTLTMEEANTQQSQILRDLLDQVARLEERIVASPESTPLTPSMPGPREGPMQPPPRSQTISQGPILWVDDNPKNNSFFVQRLCDESIQVMLARSTAEALSQLAQKSFAGIISDMGRVEQASYNTRAGLELLQRVRAEDQQGPFVIYCSPKRAEEVRDEALRMGATEVVSSPTRLSAILFARGDDQRSGTV